MQFAGSKRLHAVVVVLLAVCAERSFAEELLPPKPVALDVAVPMPRAAARSVRTVINGVTLIYQEFRQPTEETPVDPELEFDRAENPTRSIDRPVESKVLMGENALDQILFGPGWTIESAEYRCRETLHQKIEACGRIVELTETQKRKLQLAGYGDVARLFAKVSRHQSRFEKLADEVDSVAAFTAWQTKLTNESRALQSQWKNSAPFESGSLFAKTLATLLAPEQVAELNRRQNDPGLAKLRGGNPVRPFRSGPLPANNIRLAVADERNPQAKSLEVILQEWERAAAKIERLDCTFTKFMYEPTFEIERRATGSLAVDQHGRAVYRQAAVPIDRAERSKKKNRDGEPYTLQAARPERWHWTGNKVFRVDETEHTYDEVTIPAAEIGIPVAARAPREFHPDPPALPEENDRPGFGAPRAPENAAPRHELPIQQATKPQSLRDWIRNVFAGVPVEKKRSNVDSWNLFLSWCSMSMRELWLTRPFLLGMSAATLKERFTIQVLKQSETEIWLSLIPKRRADAAMFDKAVLILDAKRYVPKAIQMFDPTEAETVHVFRDVQINLVRDGQVVPAGVENFDRPDLRGYRPAIEVLPQGRQ